MDYPFSYIEDQESLYAWLINIQHLTLATFGSTNLHYRKIQELTNVDVCSESQIATIRGVLKGSLNDLENGFLLGQEFIIAGEIFDSLLEEAKYGRGCELLKTIIARDSLYFSQTRQ